MTIKVAINGYGTIGKRVADAVAAQPDMEIVGVSKTSMNAEAYIAKDRGYPALHRGHDQAARLRERGGPDRRARSSR